jgi:hypothetical protein
MMIVWLIIGVPIVALFAWGLIFDLKRRRRRDALTGHDIGSAARWAQGNADALNVGWRDSGGGSI